MHYRGSRFLTDFGSSVSAVGALSSFLRGEDFHALPVPGGRVLARALSALPECTRSRLYRTAAFVQAAPERSAPRLDIDELDQWLVDQYGAGPFPAVVVGVPSGAAVHLAAALGAPFLPQTTLSSIRHRTTHPDDPSGAMAAISPTTRLIAHRNPRVAVYHMHDPAQDRPMIERFAFLRLKRLTLGPIYEKFLTERLAPGGTIVQVEAMLRWRIREVGERAYFQLGSIGGLSEDEYHDGSPRVARYLEQQGSPVRKWSLPEMDEHRRIEGEWGWDPTLGEDIARTAEREGFAVRRFVAPHPQGHSPFAAELYRWWYDRLGAPTNRLLVETYAQWDPLWVLRTGSVPYWLNFHTEPEKAALESYLNQARPFDHIHINLLSHGVRSPGVVPVEDWTDLAQQHARKSGGLIGVDEETYPLDLGSTLRFSKAFADIPARQELPTPLTVTDVDTFAAEHAEHTTARWC